MFEYRYGIDLPIPLRYATFMNVNTQIRQIAQRGIATRGWSQAELAKRAGVKQATVSRLLTGERRGEPETWERLLSALGFEIAAIPIGTDLSQLIGKDE